MESSQSPTSKVWIMRDQTSISSSHCGENDIEPHAKQVNPIKQAASRYLHQLGVLRAKLMDYHSYLYTWEEFGDLLEGLADRHGKVMDSMITDLQTIAFTGCGMRCSEPHYQEQNDHPLAYLVAALDLSPCATTVLASADKATLEELATKVAEQQTKMKRNETSANELSAIREELREQRSQGQSMNHHSDIRLRDLQKQMADAQFKLAKLECLTVDPSSEHSEPVQSGPPKPSEETTGRADPVAEHRCLLCGRTTLQSGAGWGQPHGKHLEVSQVKPAAHFGLLFGLSDPVASFTRCQSLVQKILAMQLNADWCFEFTHEGVRYTNSSKNSDPNSDLRNPGRICVGKSLGGKLTCHPCGEAQIPRARCFALSPNGHTPCLQPIFHWGGHTWLQGITPHSPSPVPQDSADPGKQEETDMMEQWGSVFDEWSSYSLDQLDCMFLPQGHPLFIRRENLRHQKQHNGDDKKTQPGELDQLLYDPLEEATLRETRAQFWENHRQQKQNRTAMFTERSMLRSGRAGTCIYCGCHEEQEGRTADCCWKAHKVKCVFHPFPNVDEAAASAQFVEGSQATEARCDDDTHSRASRASTNTQKYVDERYAVEALAQSSAQHWTNDKNHDDTGVEMRKDDKLCSEDPAMRDKSASALLPEEATLSEIAAQPEEERRQQGQH